MLGNINSAAHEGQLPKNAIFLHQDKKGYFQLTQPLKYKGRDWVIDLKNPESGNFAILGIGTIIQLDGNDLRFAHGNGEQKFYHKEPFLGAKYKNGNGEWEDIYILGITRDQIHTSLDIIDTQNTLRMRALGLIKD